MRTHRIEVETLLLAALLSLTLGPLRAGPPASPATTASVTAPVAGPEPARHGLPQEAVVGDLQVEMGRPLRLKLGLHDLAAIQRAAGLVVHAMAPAASTTASTPLTLPLDVLIRWNDPASLPQTLPVTDNVAEVSVPYGNPRTATFFVTWRAADGSFELTVPARPRGFKAQIVRPQSAIVLEATGTAEGVLFGDRVPVSLRVLDIQGVAGVTIYHRSDPARPYSSAPMERAEGADWQGLWKASLARPAGLEVTIDYCIDIVDKAGKHSAYGTPELPQRIKLLDPSKER
ncbi:MAG: hypothetical protein HY814_09010 [Candidatus Riflebacteria bacterium]|nr:hypothetical protein [Candidatus Riflebacteria bacterium]